MDFKKLAEVELLDSAPEGATAFAEVNGEVKRVVGGIGGGSTGYVWDVTDKLKAALFGSEEVSYEDNRLSWTPTEEEVRSLTKSIISAGGLTIKADFGAVLSHLGQEATGVYTTSGPMLSAMESQEACIVSMGLFMGEGTLPTVVALYVTEPSTGELLEATVDILIPFSLGV